MSKENDSPPLLTAAEIEDRPWGIATDIDGWLAFRDRSLATIDAERARADEAYQQGFNEAKSLREDEVARLGGEVTALREALRQAIEVVRDIDVEAADELELMTARALSGEQEAGQ